MTWALRRLSSVAPDGRVHGIPLKSCPLFSNTDSKLANAVDPRLPLLVLLEVLLVQVLVRVLVRVLVLVEERLVNVTAD